MKNHPGHFWICFWIVVAMISVSSDVADIKKAINENTAAVRALAR